jgi:DNA-directed RNA polymerase subunit L
MNTLRRTIMELIPIYAFDKNDIDITKNTSIYNNDYMRIRLCQFPVIGILNNYDTINRSAELEYEANISTFEKKVEDLSILEQKELIEKTEKSKNFTMYVNIKNTTNEILNVTTDELYTKFYYNAEIIESPYKQKLLIIKLKPGEEFRCTTISTLNIGLKGSHYMPNSVCTFSEPIFESNKSDSESDSESKTEIKTNLEYKFNLESLKQISEKEIIIRACAIIDIKLNNFLNILTKKIIEYKSELYCDDFNLDNKIVSLTESDTITDSAIRNTSDDVLEQHRIKGIIKIENESHTFGNLLTRYIQDHPSILFAGYKINHLLIKELTIGYKTDGVDIVNILNDIIAQIKTIYAEIKLQIEELEI